MHYLAKVISSDFGKSDNVQLLKQATPAFIPLDLWPTNSPDLLTRPLLTMQLMSGVGIFARVQAKDGHFEQVL